MPNDWSGLNLGSVNVRGATPPISNTGPGGATGMGLMALLRRLSMGMDDRGPDELPQPMSPDPASERGMAQMLGLDTGYDWGRGAMNAADAAGDWRSSPVDVMTAALSGGPAATGQPMMDTQADMAATGQPMQPLPQGPPVPMSKPSIPMENPGMGMPAAPMGMPAIGQMTPEMMRQIYEQEMARLNGTGAGY